jgi:tRNA dimethylallyltransferase
VNSSKTLIVIVGPTAVGKTSIAVQLAKHYSCEILSADSRQFYKELSIGTAKPDTQEMNGIPHHFIDNLSINDDYSAGIYEKEALDKLDELYATQDYAILVGGSGLFINALCFGLDDIPKASNLTREKLNIELETKGLTHIQNRVQSIDPDYYAAADVDNARRLIRALEVFETTGKTLTSYQKLPKTPRNFNFVWIGLDMPREQLYKRINLRVDHMIKDGLLNEVASLEKHKSLNPLKTVGYQEFYELAKSKEGTPVSTENINDQEIDANETAINLVKRNSRRYAKRQLTWFRRNKDIRWFNPDQLSEITEYLKTL